MVGKVRVVFLAIVMVAMAGAVQAEIIPMVVGYNATYSVTWAGSPSTNPYTASMQITGGPQDIGEKQWWTLQFNNWDGNGVLETSLIRATEDAVYLNGSAIPHFQTGAPGLSWTDEGGRSVRIAAVDDSFATFTGVYRLEIDDYSDGTLYQTLKEYWKPGVGFLGEVVPRSYNGTDLFRTTYMTAYSTSAVPVPPSLLLLGSGLIGLLGFRRFRRS
jgi:hypothetical protein